jgi:type I restriction enzyme S subunit
MKWATIPLGGLCIKIGSGATPRGGNESYKQSGVALVRSMNVHLGRFKPDDLAFIDETQAAKLNNVVLEKNDVLLNITGASVARCCMLDNSVLPARVNQHVCILRPESSRLNCQYLMRFLTTEQTQQKLLNIAGAGATREAITKSEIEKFSIPLPPLAEQKRIAAILDAADALRAKRREALAQLDALLQSTFLTLFGDPVSNPMGWAQAELGDLVADDDRINYGVVQPGEEYPGGRPLIRVGDFVGGELDLSGIKFIDPKIDAQYERSRLLGTELLVSCVGSIGTVCRVPLAAKGHNIARAVARVPLGPKVEREFMLFCLRSAGVQNYFSNETRTVSQPTLNIGLIKTATVTTPPLPLQQKFASIVESVERQKAAQRAHLAELDALFAALQHRAFRGEL